MIRFHDAVLPLLVEIDQVRPHPENSNNGDVDAVIESITLNGMYGAIGVQRSTGYIVRGHTTYAACLALGSQTVPVLWYDVNDTEALRILMADNRTARLAQEDPALLRENLRRLQESEVGLLGTGYTDMDVALLEQQMEEEAARGFGHSAPDEPEPDITQDTTVCPNCGHIW